MVLPKFQNFGYYELGEVAVICGSVAYFALQPRLISVKILPSAQETMKNALKTQLHNQLIGHFLYTSMSLKRFFLEGFAVTSQGGTGRMQRGKYHREGECQTDTKGGDYKMGTP